MDTIEIVDYRDEYAREISTVIQENLLGVNSKEYPMAEMVAMANQYREQDILAFSRERKILVALREGKVVGTAGFSRARHGEPCTCHIRAVYVSPELHGGGIGGKLMDAAEALARSSGIRRITLNTSMSAQAFYESHGYHVIQDPVGIVGSLMEKKFDEQDAEDSAHA